MENIVHEAKHAAKATVPELRDNACCRVASVIINFNLEAHNLVFMACDALIWVNGRLLDTAARSHKYPQGGSTWKHINCIKYNKIERMLRGFSSQLQKTGVFGSSTGHRGKK